MLDTTVSPKKLSQLGFPFLEIVEISRRFREQRLAEQTTQDAIREIGNTLIQQEQDAVIEDIDILENDKAFRCFHFDRLKKRLDLAKLRDYLGLPEPSKIHEILKMKKIPVDRENIYEILEIS